MRNRWLTGVTFALFTAVILAAGAAGAFAAAPPNDVFATVAAGPALTATSGTIAGTNVGATLDTGEVPPSGNTASIWYKWTAPADDIVSFDTAGSVDGVGDPLPTHIHVYTGTTVNTLVEVPESFFPGDLFPRGHVEAPVRATTDYYIAITSPALAVQGNTVLNWQTKGNTGHITGTVTATNGGTLLQGMQVDAYRVGGAGNSLRTVQTLANGTYDLTGLGTGSYQVRFTDPAPTTYLTEWYNNAPTSGSSTPIAVTNGATTSGRNAALDRAAGISGTVKANGVGTVGVAVKLLSYTGGVYDLNQPPDTVTVAGGAYSFAGLYPKVGTGNYYIVQFIEPFASGFTTQFYNQASSLLLATKLQPVEGTAIPNVNCVWPGDVTAPTTALASTPATGYPTATGWRRGPVALQFTAADNLNGSGMAKTLVSIDGTGPVEFTAWPAIVNIANEAATSTVKYWSVDGAGNVEASKTATFRVDGTKPNTTSNAASNYPVGGGTIALTPTDGGSGVVRTQWQLTGPAPTTSGTGTSVTIPTSPKGEYTLLFWATDNVGNAEAAKQAVFTVGTGDLVAPIVSTSVSPSGWTSTTVEVKLTATDVPSGVSGLQIKKPGVSVWADQANNTSFTVNSGGTLNFQAWDSQDNTRTGTLQIKIDPTAPVTNATFAASYVPTSGAVVSLVPTDTQSGVASTSWTILKDGATPVASGADLTVEIPDPLGSYTVKYFSVDKAGNAEGTNSRTFIVSSYTPITVWRFRYTSLVGNYLWTSDPAESETIKATLAGTWAYEGPAFTFNSANPVNVDTMWRFKNKYMWSYFYSADPAEVATVRADPNSIWQYEGPTNIKISRKTTTPYPVWRFRCLKNPTYLWTADPNEMKTIDTTLKSDYQLEGVAYWLGK